MCLPATSATRRRAHRDEGMRRCSSSRGPDRDSLFISLAGHLCRNQYKRHAQRAAGGAGSGRLPCPAYIHQRGVWHGAVRSHHRRASAAGAVAVLGQQDRCGPVGAVVRAFVRHASDVVRPIQHLRPAAIRARGHSHHHHADCGRSAVIKLGSMQPDPRFQFCCRHCRWLYCRAARRKPVSEKSSISAAGSRFRSAMSRG